MSHGRNNQMHIYKAKIGNNFPSKICTLHYIQFSSVQFSRSVVSDSLWPHGLQHTWLPCPLLFPWVCSNSCPLSRWCHPNISSSVSLFSFYPLFSSCPQSFPESGSFPVSQLFTSGGHSIGASASTPVLPVNIQDRFPLGLAGLISLLSKGLKSLLQQHSSKALVLRCSAFFMVLISRKALNLFLMISAPHD